MGNRNIEDSASLLKTADGSISSIQDMIQKIRELTIQAKNGTNSPNDVQSIQQQINSLINEIDHTAKTTTFNDQNILTKGSGILFDGTNSYVNLQNPVHNPSDWTMEFWFKANADPTYADGMVGEVNNPRITWGTSGWPTTHAPRIEFLTSTGNTMSSGDLNVGQWYHVAAVAKNASSSSPTLSLYINGVLQRQLTGNPINPFDSTVYLGKRDGTNYFNGEIDDVQIWNEAKTASEIQDNMGATLTGQESNLAGYWTFDESSGTTTKNLTGTTPDGQLLADAKFNTSTIKTGDNTKDEIDYSIGDMESVRLGLNNFNATNPDAINILDSALDYTSSERGKIGSLINRLDFSNENNQAEEIQTSQSLSRISDADFTEETSNLTKEQIKMQISMQMLKENNSNRETVLSLLQS